MKRKAILLLNWTIVLTCPIWFIVVAPLVGFFAISETIKDYRMHKDYRSVRAKLIDGDEWFWENL